MNHDARCLNYQHFEIYSITDTLSNTMSSIKTKLVVAAIDFGTTYSGYAYSFRNEYKKDPMKIYANAAWSADGEGLVTLKAPTIVLFDKDGKFHSFGFEAETKYMILAEEDKHKGWRYFKRFKMKLNEKTNIRRDMMIADDQGNKMSAKEVFAKAIEFLKDHLLSKLRQSVNTMTASDIHWVLTVPAIWHDGAKQFMREAAAMGGIPEDQLTLALEPEAAALYCKQLAVNRTNEESTHAELQSFKPGAKFVVLDLGGGTVDITVHEIENNDTLKELCAPSGGPWGGILVDAAFKRFVDSLFTEGILNEFSKESKVDELDLFRAFELKKRGINKTPPNGNAIVMKIPNALFEVFNNQAPENFAAMLKKSSFAITVVKKKDKLHIQQELFVEMFQEPREELVAHLRNLLAKPALSGVETLLMVGGFSESAIMNSTIQKAFRRMNVIIPNEAGLAVVKGAVMYGHNTDSVSCRKMPHTYGISVAVPFDDKIHPMVKKVVKNGLEKCEDVFKVFVKAGTTVVAGKTSVQHTFNTPFAGSSKATVEIYKTPQEEPRYVSDEGCQRVGELEMNLVAVKAQSVQVLEVIMHFGNTDLQVSAKEQGTSNTVKARFNFLS